MERFSRTVLRNSAFGMAAQMVIKPLSFGFSVLIVRHLGAEAFGQYAAVNAFGWIFLFISDLGLSPHVVRQVARWRDAPDGRERTNELCGNILRLRLWLSALAGVLLITTAWLTGRPLVMVGAIALNAVGIILYSAHGTFDATLAGFERLDLSAGAKVLHQLVFVGVGAAALWLGLGYYGLILANLLGIGLLTYICWRGIRALGVRPGPPAVITWPALLRASLPFGVIGFALGLSYKFDSVLLNIFRGDVETGYYNAAYGLVFSAVLFSNVVNTSLYPSLTRENASAPARLLSISEHMLRYLLILSLPIAVGAWALADQLVPFLFDVEYLPAIPALQIVIWVIPLMYLSEFLGYVVAITGRESRAARAVLVSTGLNVALNLFLVPRFGFVGAAVMTVVTEAMLVSQHLWTVRLLVRQMHWGQILLRPLFAGIVMGAVVRGLAPYVPFLLNVLVGAVVYGALALVFGALGKDDLRFVQLVRQSRTQPTPTL